MRHPIEVMLDGIEWRECPPQAPGDLPHITHEGELHLPGVTIRVVQLSDGQRVIPADDFERLMAHMAGGDAIR